MPSPSQLHTTGVSRTRVNGSFFFAGLSGITASGSSSNGRSALPRL
jgi:hypothetical protein